MGLSDQEAELLHADDLPSLHELVQHDPSRELVQVPSAFSADCA